MCEKPTEPNALTADLVHAVIPVTTAEEQKTVLSRASVVTTSQGTLGMLIYILGEIGALWSFVAIVLV